MCSFVSPFVRTRELGNIMNANLFTCWPVFLSSAILASRLCLGGKEKGWRLSNSFIPFTELQFVNIVYRVFKLHFILLNEYCVILIKLVQTYFNRALKSISIFDIQLKLSNVGQYTYSI